MKNPKYLVPFLNLGHFIDHLSMLVFPTVVVALARNWQQSYSELLPLAVGGFNAVMPNLYWREAPGADPRAPNGKEPCLAATGEGQVAQRRGVRWSEYEGAVLALEKGPRFAWKPVARRRAMAASLRARA